MGHGPVLNNLIKWCKLSVAKTEDMQFDFHRNPPTAPPTVIKGSPVSQYLGTIWENKLTFEPSTHRICKTVNQRLFYLRKLRTFHIKSSLVKTSYLSFVESVLKFAIFCWFFNLSLVNKNMLGTVVKQ